ncbi:hypothetical protein DFJ58DRAFT_786117 [Suillus subalutaceus]|uniref:uncharacterized protein n=1 Tax=Suillus subalutaceus TaxID=48586 RepID=UPI001B882F38|nr:uncharacterized protein DFJ58DRAFT_786117 [Suillus subalutaceus]KAG1855331.1 hypothetical protein DFJ58DRAFT_786117 [Suillus subalutaceus]
MSSSELQYIIELSGQRLLAVPNTGNRTPTSNRLQTLRDRAHAWFKFDMHSFKTISLPEDLYAKKKLVTDGHLYLRDEGGDLATIIPILPKPSQRTIERYWSAGTLCLVPYSTTLDVLMDPAQNLIAIVYSVPDEDDPLESNEMVSIDLRTLDGDSVHPEAAGRTLIVSGPAGYDDNVDRIETMCAKLKGCGRHIALQRTLVVDGTGDRPESVCHLQIWDWKNSTISSSVLSDTVPYPFEDSIDFCFLGNNRLLVVTDYLKLYSIEDVSQTPQFLACFQAPLPLSDVQCHLPVDDIEHSSSQLQMQTQQTMHTSDPTHRLLCFTSSYPTTLVFIISTRIFFDLDGIVATTPIPWDFWGPSNTRVFRYPYLCKVHVSGNRVLQAFTVGAPDTCPTEYDVHMMDFSPLAVPNRQGLGRVVKEPSTIQVTVLTSDSEENLKITTSLPYVEVISDRKFNVRELEGIWLDKDRIYLFNANWDCDAVGSLQYLTSQSSRLEVIDV